MVRAWGGRRGTAAWQGDPRLFRKRLLAVPAEDTGEEAGCGCSQGLCLSSWTDRAPSARSHCHRLSEIVTPFKQNETHWPGWFRARMPVHCPRTPDPRSSVAPRELAAQWRSRKVSGGTAHAYCGGWRGGWRQEASCCALFRNHSPQSPRAWRGVPPCLAGRRSWEGVLPGTFRWICWNILRYQSLGLSTLWV